MCPVMRDSHPSTDPAATDDFGLDGTSDHLPAEVTALFGAMTRYDTTDPAPALIQAMSARTTSPTPPTRNRTMIAKALTAKAAATAAVVLMTATGAAAATGSLPDAAQDGIAEAANHIGINLPESADDRARDQTEDVGPAEDNHGTDVSGVATETDATGADKGAEISTTARDGHGQAPAASDDTPTPAGKPAASGTDDNPAPVDTPNPGGTDTAGDASDGANSTGTTNAADQAADGSGNADNHPTPEDHPTGQP